MRNLEFASNVARAKRKAFVLILCAEQAITVRAKTFEEPLPRLSPAERNELGEHYLGCLTWNAIVEALCPQFVPPDTLDEALNATALSVAAGATV